MEKYLANIAKAMVVTASEIQHWFFHPDWRKNFAEWKETTLKCDNVIKLALQKPLQDNIFHLWPQTNKKVSIELLQ